MLIAQIDCAKPLVKVTAGGTAYAEITMMIAATADTRLVGYTYQPVVVIVPEGFIGYMTNFWILLILDVI